MSDLKVPFNIESDYSEGFVDFYGKQPKWIIRYGLPIIISVIILLIFLSWMVRYPDTVSSRVSVTSEKPPVYVKAKINGMIERVLLGDYAQVKKGDIIGVLENNAEYSDYLFLKEVMSTGRYDTLLNTNLIVGEMQDALNNFMFELQRDRIKKQLKENDVRENDLYNSLSEERRRVGSQLKKLQLLNEELRLEEIRIQRYRELYTKGVIAKHELENYEKDFLNKKQIIEDNRSFISSTRIDIINIQKSINENKIKDSELDLIQQENIENSRLLLFKKIADWEEQYLLVSPIDGVLVFHNFLVSENKNVTTDQEVFSITPTNYGKLFCIMEIPVARSGKVKKGQQVNIFLDNFPFEEFGILKGKITNISSIPSSNGYLSKVELVNGLETSYNIKIDFKPYLTGRAKVITEDMNLLNRIFNKFIQLFENA